MQAHLQKKDRPIPDLSPRTLQTLLVWCVNKDPRGRPSVEVVEKRLLEIEAGFSKTNK